MSHDPVDVVVFAPHPDDEVIGTGAVIRRAVTEGRRVRVVFTTSGDGYPRAAATLAGKTLGDLEPADFIRLGETRRAEAEAADALLGLAPDDLAYLGFPDGSFDQVLAAGGSRPVQSPLTQLAESPTKGTPYTRGAALEAFAHELAEARPSEIYTTHPADEHRDHSATFRVVTEAMARAGSKARLLTFMVHAGHDRWPDPGPRYETKEIGGVLYPRGVSWPPPIRIPLGAEESELKRRALMEHSSQWTLDHEYLGAFVKSEEVFWQ